MKILKYILYVLFIPFISIYETIRRTSVEFKPLFCKHNWEYRDIVIRTDEHKGIDGTVFRNYFRKCHKCRKCQRANKLPGKWGTWINIDEIDLSHYPKNIPIEHKVRLYGEPTQQEKRQIKLDKLLEESDS